jgi:hypothetical protein
MGAAITLCAVRLRRLRGYDRLLSIAVIFVISFPVLFAIDRGNLDLWIFPLVGAFLLFFYSRRPYLYQMGLLALAFAISLKIYPAIFALLILKERRFIDFLTVIVVCCFLTLIASAAFVGGIGNALTDYLGMLSTTDGLLKQSLQYANNNLGIYYAVQMTVELLGKHSWWDFVALRYGQFAIFLLLMGSVAIWYLPFSLAESSLALALLTCLLPSLSFTYRLIVILFPLLLLMTSRARSARSVSVTTVAVALLLIPKNYLILFPEVRPDIGISSLLDPLLLCVLVAELFTMGIVNSRYRVPGHITKMLRHGLELSVSACAVVAVARVDPSMPLFVILHFSNIFWHFGAIALCLLLHLYAVVRAMKAAGITMIPEVVR